jgi:hypothetical protein
MPGIGHTDTDVPFARPLLESRTRAGFFKPGYFQKAGMASDMKRKFIACDQEDWHRAFDCLEAYAPRSRRAGNVPDRSQSS